MSEEFIKKGNTGKYKIHRLKDGMGKLKPLDAKTRAYYEAPLDKKEADEEFVESAKEYNSNLKSHKSTIYIGKGSKRASEKALDTTKKKIHKRHKRRLKEILNSQKL